MDDKDLTKGVINKFKMIADEFHKRRSSGNYCTSENFHVLYSSRKIDYNSEKNCSGQIQSLYCRWYPEHFSLPKVLHELQYSPSKINYSHLIVNSQEY